MEVKIHHGGAHWFLVNREYCHNVKTRWPKAINYCSESTRLCFFHGHSNYCRMHALLFAWLRETCKRKLENGEKLYDHLFNDRSLMPLPSTRAYLYTIHFLCQVVSN